MFLFSTPAFGNPLISSEHLSLSNIFGNELHTWGHVISKTRMANKTIL